MLSSSARSATLRSNLHSSNQRLLGHEPGALPSAAPTAHARDEHLVALRPRASHARSACDEGLFARRPRASTVRGPHLAPDRWRPINALPPSSRSSSNPIAHQIPKSAAMLMGKRLDLHRRILALIGENKLDEAVLLTRRSFYSDCCPTVFTCNTVFAALLCQARYDDLLSLHRFVNLASGKGDKGMEKETMDCYTEVIGEDRWDCWCKTLDNTSQRFERLHGRQNEMLGLQALERMNEGIKARAVTQDKVVVGFDDFGSCFTSVVEPDGLPDKEMMGHCEGTLVDTGEICLTRSDPVHDQFAEAYQYSSMMQQEEPKVLYSDVKWDAPEEEATKLLEGDKEEESEAVQEYTKVVIWDESDDEEELVFSDKCEGKAELTEDGAGEENVFDEAEDSKSNYYAEKVSSSKSGPNHVDITDRGHHWEDKDSVEQTGAKLGKENINDVEEDELLSIAVVEPGDSEIRRQSIQRINNVVPDLLQAHMEQQHLAEFSVYQIDIGTLGNAVGSMAVEYKVVVVSKEEEVVEQVTGTQGRIETWRLLKGLLTEGRLFSPDNKATTSSFNIEEDVKYVGNVASDNESKDNTDLGLINEPWDPGIPWWPKDCKVQPDMRILILGAYTAILGNDGDWFLLEKLYYNGRSVDRDIYHVMVSSVVCRVIILLTSNIHFLSSYLHNGKQVLVGAPVQIKMGVFLEISTLQKQFQPLTIIGLNLVMVLIAKGFLRCFFHYSNHTF